MDKLLTNLKNRYGAPMLYGLLACASLQATEAPKSIRFNIPSQALETALLEFSEQAQMQVVVANDLAKDRVSEAVQGEHSVSEALKLLLAHSGLYFRFTGERTIAITGELAESQAPGDRAPKPLDSSEASRRRGEARPSETELEQISVTASRITHSGFEAPTPTTVIDSIDIASHGALNVATVLNQIPSFVGTTTPASTGFAAGIDSGASFLDLRGLGSSRTLILVNGRRHVSTTEGGMVDVSLIPQALIERVEVVTGGASAAWGSDAIAGVVNFILNDEFEGVQASGQLGISAQGDNREDRLALAWGNSFANGRGHLVVAGEATDSDGIADQRDRDWARPNWQVIANPSYVPGTGVPMLLVARDVHQVNRTEGGLIISGPLAGAQFGANGEIIPFEFGSARNSEFMIGGDGLNQGMYVSLSVPSQRRTLSGILRYALSETVRARFEASFGTRRSTNDVLQSFSITPYRIWQDNAFLPESLRAQLQPGESFGLGRVNTDFGFIESDIAVSTRRAVAGLEGEWGENKWSAYYQYGQTSSRERLHNNVLVGNLERALDAIRLPDGTIACRSSLAIPNDDCVPLNPFGYGLPSPAALDYILDTQKVENTVDQHVIGVDLQSEPFSVGAGPVSIALGAEYREQSARVRSDPLAQADAFFIGNTKSLHGRYEVIEAFAEAALPVFKDIALGKSLDVNGALRLTDYSTSGGVATWKLGVSYVLNEGLKVRATRSRDIRAPSLSELFLPSVAGFFPITDPRTADESLTATDVRGNPDLDPEKADTFTAGAVVQSSRVPGLRASIDYFRVNLRDAIQVLHVQDVVDRCFAGVSELCEFVIRGPSNEITRVISAFVNIAARETHGIDLEISYVAPLRQFVSRWDGDITFRVLGTYVDALVTSDGLVSVDRAGELGLDNGGIPRLRLAALLGYDRDPFSASLTGRYVAGGEYDNTFLESVDINDNSVPARFYLNATLQYVIHLAGGHDLRLIGVVNNVLDQDPPIVPSSSQFSLASNPAHYDVYGRSYVAGIRFDF